MATVIKPLLEWDEVIADIEAAATELSWSRTNLRSCFSPSYQVFGYFPSATSKPVAYLILHQQLSDEWTVMNIAVHPQFQRQGIGAQLIEHVCQLAQRQLATIWLEVRESNQVAFRLYERVGFIQCGYRKDYYPTAAGGREAAIVMCWKSPSD